MTRQTGWRSSRTVTLYQWSEARPDNILQIFPQPPGGALGRVRTATRQGIHPEVGHSAFIRTSSSTTGHNSEILTIKIFWNY